MLHTSSVKLRGAVRLVSRMDLMSVTTSFPVTASSIVHTETTFTMLSGRVAVSGAHAKVVLRVTFRRALMKGGFWCFHSAMPLEWASEGRKVMHSAAAHKRAPNNILNGEKQTGHGMVTYERGCWVVRRRDVKLKPTVCIYDTGHWPPSCTAVQSDMEISRNAFG